MATWRFVLTDSGSVPLGEILNAKDRKVAKPLSNFDTASFNVRLDNPLADAIATTECWVKAYRDSTLQFHGPIISAEENLSDESASIAVNCVGVGWDLSKRLAGKSATGDLFVNTTRCQIVEGLINIANGAGHTKVLVPGSGAQGGFLPAFTAGPYKPLMEVIKELSVGVDGFDWRIDPVDNYANGAVTGVGRGSFFGRTVIGQARPHSVFEFGTGRNNVLSYKRMVDRGGQANQVYHNAAAGPDAPGYPTVTAWDMPSITKWGLLEDLANADLLNLTHRQQIVNAHVAIRKDPRQVVEFVPHVDDGRGRVPQFGTDFELGDQIRGRFAYNDVVRLDAYMRLYGVSFEIDENGMERPTFTLVQEGS